MNDYYLKQLPPSIRLLFSNEYLECLMLLCILKVFKNKIKGLALEEILYYFTILKSLETEKKGYKVNYIYIQNTYFYLMNNLKTSIIYLSNDYLIDINVDKKNENILLKVVISDKGKKVIDELESDYYREIFEKCQYIKQNLPYNTENKSIVWRTSWNGD